MAARLAREPGLTLAGGDARVAAVLEGAALGALAERLLAAGERLLGVSPTYVAPDDQPARGERPFAPAWCDRPRPAPLGARSEPQP